MPNLMDHPQITAGMILEFIYNRRNGTGLATWSAGEILTYILEETKKNHLAVLDDGQGNIHAVVVFDPEWRNGEFYIEQIWSSSKLAVGELLKLLRREFPGVDTVFGYRTNRVVEFKLNTLEKIYGRR